MKSLKGTIALIGVIGIYAMTGVVYADSTDPKGTGTDVEKEDKSLTSVFLSFFGKTDKKKDVVPELTLLKKPTKENASQYITLSEPSAQPGQDQDKKKLSIEQSFTVKSSLVFNMGNSGQSSSSPGGFSGLGASAAGNQLTFSYGNKDGVQNNSAVNISIGSQFLIEPSSVMSPLYDGSGFEQINNRQVYNLSLGVGYAGFNLGASYSREKMLFDSGLKGFDIGLGFTGSNWGADVKIGEYKREHDRLFASTEDFYNTVYALEIGAAYQLYSNIRFTGRFTYYAYGQDRELDQLKNSQVFFLGTNVNF